MKKIYTAFALLLFAAFSSTAFAQTAEDNGEGGAYPMEVNDAAHPCITTQEYELIEKTCIENRKRLGLPLEGQRSANTTSLIWPLRAAANLHDCGYYTISAGVDHNAATPAIKDYNCGSKTYDGHRGTDIPAFPFGFHKMDSSQVEVIAAAAGTILYKLDGNLDRNCATNNLAANAVVIEHADGSQTHYWHMKNGSVTSKIVGQTVTAGEYLGVVGSSGNSSGPHLHFEVWSGSTVSTLVDPYAGTCNLMNATSWWANQKPYNDPTAIKVSVNTTDIVVPACPGSETLNESSSYTIPFQGAGLSPGYAKFYLFMRDETAALTANLSILNPNGSTFNSWTYTSNTPYNSSYRSFSKLLPTIAGTYTFKATYNGTICSTTFNIITTTSVNETETPDAFSLFPNPATNSVTINIDETMLGSTAKVTDITGRRIAVIKLVTRNLQLTTENFLNGTYFVTIEGEMGRVTKKLVIQK
ncbi:MAG: peptidoglycan DD-metalloendopeptidase family protein [Bacteroidetes bacterium]|nr:peptidoglycan DD-metalloendopeptidase family protein [Bacteroidota bacterium]